MSGQIFGLILSFFSNRYLWVVPDGKFSKEYSVNSGVPQGSILVLTLFLLYINDLPDDVICNIAVLADDTTLHSKCDQASDQWQELELANWHLNLNQIYETLWTEAGNSFLISVLEKLDWFLLTGLVTLVLMMWKWMSLFSKKNQITFK